MTARDHLLIPFRGIRDAGQDVAAGSAVMGRHLRRIMTRIIRVAWRAAWKGETLHDRLEALGLAVLAGGVAATVAGAVLGAVGAYVARAAAPFAPALFIAAVMAWGIAAQFAAPRREPDAPSEPPSEAPVAFAQWLLQTIGDKPGIHLRELYPAMRKLPGQEDRDDTQLRGALRALGIPVHRSLRIGRVAGRSGVRLADVEALASPAGEPSVDNSGDAGQRADSPVLSTVGERVETA